LGQYLDIDFEKEEVMSGNHWGVLEKTGCARLLKEVRELTHRRDNMVARIASMEDEGKKFRIFRSEWLKLVS
jgi:hypothetical protein